jgi:hypothetical protein
MIGLLFVSMILQFTVFDMQVSLAVAQKKYYQQKLGQHNQCKGNGTKCTNVASNDIPMSTSSPNDKQKGDNTGQSNSNNHNSQTDTPLLLPFP